MTQDIIQAISWWLVLFVLGLVNLPAITLFFKKFYDSGYGLVKTISTLVTAYLVFLFAIFKILPFNIYVIYAVIFILICLNSKLFLQNKKELIALFRKKYKIFIFQELFFLAGFLFWTWVRAHQPDISGLEKFMDYGFINSLLNSKYLPPEDMWFAGKPINYYWFGHFWSAFLTKVSGIESKVTYNLMIATILGLSLNISFSIISTLTQILKVKKKKLIWLSGIISAILLVFGGNFHTPFYAIKESPDKYWYPDATRFIGYNPETNDKTIHEFPQYSFVVSDLHAHLLNLPFALTFVALLLVFYIKNASVYKKLLPLGFFLGVMFMTNTWDFANLSLLMGVTFLLYQLKKKNKIFPVIVNTTIFCTFVLLGAFLTAFPFVINFESIAQGVKTVNSQSPVWQLLILWGFPLVLTLVFLVTLFVESKKKNIKSRAKNVFASIFSPGTKILAFLKTSDLFVIGILVSSWILIFLPEFVYVKDIYVSSHHRANTMFKLTYQAFVLFYLSSGYIIIRAISFSKRKVIRVFVALFFTLIMASLLWYPTFAVDSYYAGLKTYKGLDGEKWMARKYPNEYQALIWIRNNTKKDAVILEAQGDSYTDFNALSAYSGRPTINGWFVHEWLWRGSAEIPQERINDIVPIYTSADVAKTKELLKKYSVNYVIVGSMERQKYAELNEEKFKKLGKEVFAKSNIRIYKVSDL